MRRAERAQRTETLCEVCMKLTAGEQLTDFIRATRDIIGQFNKLSELKSPGMELPQVRATNHLL